RLSFYFAAKSHWDEAIAAYRQAIALRPAFWQFYPVLGDLYTQRPATRAEAIAAYEEALRLKPERRSSDLDQAFGNVHAQLGYLYNEKQEYDKAIAHFKSGIELRPGNAVVHNNLAFAYRSKGEL